MAHELLVCYWCVIREQIRDLFVCHSCFICDKNKKAPLDKLKYRFIISAGQILKIILSPLLYQEKFLSFTNVGRFKLGEVNPA